MYAVGRLGSYISRGVYTVSAPFHPFGGAVDIVVVEQQDGTFKSSPWYVRFGKFQGVLKAKEKIVDINVNGDDANFHMFLDHTGEAYFLREVDAEEGEILLSCASSVEEMGELERRPMKSKSWNEGIDSSDTITKLEVSNGTVVARSGSRRGRLMGLVFGRNNKSDMDEDAANVLRAESLEHAEIAADLLEVNWSTSLTSVRKDKGNISRLSAPEVLNNVSSADFLIDEDASLLEGGVDKVNNRTFLRQPTVYYETLDDYVEQVNETSGAKSVEASLQANTTEPESSTDVTSEVETSHVPETTSVSTFSDGEIHESEETKSLNSRVLTETSSEPVAVYQIDDSAKDVDSCGTLTIISSGDPLSSVQGETSVEEEHDAERLQPLVKPICDSEEIGSEFVKNEQINNSSSVDLDEEQFPFSDLDDFKARQVKCIEVIPINPTVKRNNSSLILEGNESSDSEFESPVKFTQEDLQVDSEEPREKVRLLSSQISIPRSNKFAVQELGGMVESLPNMRSQFDELDKLNSCYMLGRSLDSNPKLSKWASVRKSTMMSDVGSAHCSSNSQCTTKDDSYLEELKAAKTSPAIGDSSKTVKHSSNGSWGIWPFTRSRSMKDAPSALDGTRSIDGYGSALDGEFSLDNTSGIGGEKEVSYKEEVSSKEVSDIEVPSNGVPKSKANKKRIRAVSPTTEQLASLNLKEGRNTVTFTFSTPMLGKQQVDANIYLWRWDTRIVITDVDGTITKSDVLGQFMPLVGKDWSQTGVAHLFSAIKENGYQLLFLSARAISQAGITRQFLFNLKQDGKGLPDGPVVISPDGLFPSLFREVIRRAPHEFKIACLEDIKACFPSDRNPFYAGFGNRDTDEFSYLKVGIPKGKIFIINPKGEVVVNRCDNKSYTSLHALVNGMFPPTLSSEQEDFNSWNFWKLPPPLIDI